MRLQTILAGAALAMALATPVMAQSAGDPVAGKKVFNKCMACHAVDKKVVGPAYKEVAKKYAGKGADATLVEHVMKGSKGVWGPVPMPANAQVNEADAKKLVAWILSLK